MNRILPLAFFFLFFLNIQIFAQNTVGLLSYNPMKTFDGYNLIYPHNQPNVFLLNNCGEIVHTWEDSTNYRPGNTAYIMDDGNIVKTKRPSVVAGNPIWAGGGGGIVEIRSWDNDLIWQFELNDSMDRLHHDIAPMPNGNILMISWELKSEDEAIQSGRDTALLSQDKLWPDYIIEVDPSNDEIVWEWHVWDHLIQDYDNTKDNFGVVADHPELVDLNFDTNDGAADWMHTNSIDYNAELDQIMISVPTFNEIWVIDHTTTTEQAAGHTGGFGNRGGDLLYRWGNPLTYGGGTEDDQKLFYQHDAHWADRFLTGSHPDFGKIVVFNNRVGDDFSTANIFIPPWDMYNWSYEMSAGAYLPAAFDWTFTHPEPTQMHSTGLSSVQLLPNGNTLIDVGRWGYSFEVTPDDEIVWEYKTPLIGGNPANQGDTLAINNNLTFRMNRYPMDYSVFEGKDLSPKGYIENNPDTTFCDLILSDIDLNHDYQLKLYPNPATDMVVIEWDGMDRTEFEIFDIMGRQLEKMHGYGGRKYLDVSKWDTGIYFIRINQTAVTKLVITR
jgi:hypothetical protein